jgi:very-short-patch-repair endonuclease
MTYKDIKTFARELRKNQTPAELFFWNKVRKRQFMGLRFNRQFIIQHSNVLGKKSYFIPDFFCFERKIIVEIDGKIHDQQKEYDEIRTTILKEMGYHIIRFENDQVLNNWNKVAQILETFILKN